MAQIQPGTYSGALKASIGTINAGDGATLSDAEIDFTSDLDLSAVEMDNLIIPQSCRSSLGSASAGNVEVDLSGATYTGLLDYNGRGEQAHFEAQSTIAKTLIRGTGGGKFYGKGGTWTAVEQSQGIVEFNSTCDVQTYRIQGGSAKVLTHASQAVDTLEVGRDAQFYCERDITAADVYGTTTLNDYGSAITTLTQHSGRTNYVGGNITTVHGYDGVLDLSRAETDITIATLHRYSNNFVIIKPAGGFSLTITTENLYGGAESLK